MRVLISPHWPPTYPLNPPQCRRFCPVSAHPYLHNSIRCDRRRELRFSTQIAPSKKRPQRCAELSTAWDTLPKLIARNRTEIIRRITRSCRRGAMHHKLFIFTERFIMGGRSQELNYDTSSPWRFNCRPKILSSFKSVAI